MEIIEREKERDETSRLWQLFIDGDKQVFGELYKMHYNSLYTYGISMGMGSTIIKDCIQEAFLKIYLSPDIIKNPRTLVPFLFRMIRNMFLNILRSDERQFAYEELPDFTINYVVDTLDFIHKEDENFIKARVNTILLGLTARQKEIIHLKFYNKLSYAQIAQVMNFSEQSARNLLFRILQRIRNKKNYVV